MRVHTYFLIVAFYLVATIADCRADMLTAIQNGDAEQVREYISQNPALINARALNGVTPLQSAIDGKHPEIAIMLIRKGADIHLPFADGSSPLGHAAYLDEDGVVELLLSMEKPADASAQMNRALEMAILNGSLKVTTLLIAHGADANPPDSRPLLTAVSNNHPQIAQLLLAHGANCGFRDVNGNTLLHYPPRSSGKDGSLEFVDMFVACGVDVNVRNNLGETPLFVALNFGSDGLALMEHLITKGADVNARNMGGWTPLLHAAYIGKLDPETLRFLLKHGADPNARDHEGMGLLHDLAGSIGPVNLETVALAIKLGADVNAKAGSQEQRSSEGYTPLHMAAYAGHAEVGELLIASGAKLNELNAAHQTPLMLSLERGRADFARMLIKHGADVNTSQPGQPTPLALAVSRNDVGTTRLLLDHGADVQASGAMDCPLILAVRGGNLELARLLIAKGADVNAQGAGGMTALHWAALGGREELTRLLLGRGAIVGAKNSSGQTPMQIAAQPIVPLLAAKGAARPQGADLALAEQACRMVAARANNGTLHALLGTPASQRRFMRNFETNDADPELGSVDERYQIEFNGAQFFLGMADKLPIYLSRMDANEREEIVCSIGHEDKVYFARSRAETAVLHHLTRADYGQVATRTPTFPAELARALADRAEIYVVSGYEAEARKPGETGSGVVNINVDRPGRKVLLLLNSVRYIEWHVTASATTRVSAVLFTSYSDRRAQEDVPVKASVPVYRVQMPIALLEQESSQMSVLLEQLHAWAGVQRVDAFFGSYYLPATVAIAQPGTGDPRLRLDYPPVQATGADVKFDLYNRRLLPVGWSLSGPAAREARGTTYLSGGRYAFSPDRKEAYILDHDQFIVVDMKTGATSHFALPASFPPVENATDLAYDTRRNIVSVATLGGEGFFYRFDAKTHRWLDFHSFNNIDAISLAYDKAADRYLAWTTDAELLFISANGEIGTKQALGEKLPGYYRLYLKDYSQDHLVDLKPQGTHLVVVGFKDNKVSSIWYYNISTQAALLTYKAK